LPHHRGVAAEPLAPERVRQHHDAPRAGALLVGAEGAPEERAGAEQGEEAGGDVTREQLLGPPLAAQERGLAAHEGHPLRGARGLRLPVEEGGVRGEALPAVGAALGDPGEPRRVAVGEPAQQHAVHHAHHRGGGADAEREGEHRGGGEGRRAPEGPQGLPQLAADRLEHLGALRAVVGGAVDRPQLAAVAGHVAEAAARLPLGLSAGEPLARHDVGGALLDVEAQLRVRLGLEAARRAGEAERASEAAPAVVVPHAAPPAARGAVITRSTTRV
jgi:hypothetical protein